MQDRPFTVAGTFPTTVKGQSPSRCLQPHIAPDTSINFASMRSIAAV